MMNCGRPWMDELVRCTYLSRWQGDTHRVGERERERGEGSRVASNWLRVNQVLTIEGAGEMRAPYVGNNYWLDRYLDTYPPKRTHVATQLLRGPCHEAHRAHSLHANRDVVRYRGHPCNILKRLHSEVLELAGFLFSFLPFFFRRRLSRGRLVCRANVRGSRQRPENGLARYLHLIISTGTTHLREATFCRPGGWHGWSPGNQATLPDCSVLLRRLRRRPLHFISQCRLSHASPYPAFLHAWSRCYHRGAPPTK